MNIGLERIDIQERVIIETLLNSRAMKKAYDFSHMTYYIM